MVLAGQSIHTAIVGHVLDGVRIQLLGPVRAWAGPDEVELRGIMGRTVLAALALAPGSAVRTARLAEVLWDDGLPSNSTGNIQSVISRLRRGLGADRIESAPGGYRLSRDVSTDVEQTEEALRAADGLHPVVASHRIRALISQWEGSPLVDAADTVTLAPDRARLTELQLHATDRAFECALSAGLEDDIIPDAYRHAEAAPYHERAQVLLADALARVERRRDALRVLSAFRTRLAEETGLDVSERVVSLERQILTQVRG